jgi:hypothetical protein
MFKAKSGRSKYSKPSFFRSILDMVSLFQLPRQQRQVVFFSEGKTYWVHLEGLLRAYLEIGDKPVCYISSDCNDPGLKLQHPSLKCFHTDESFVRNWLFENIDTGVMVMTMPDLHQYQVKRSRHPVHYAYVQHSLVSLHMVYRSGAFDFFDSVFCSGPYQLLEARALEHYRQTSRKNLVEHGYGRLDSIITNRLSRREPVNTQPVGTIQARILVAPSWGEHSISNTVIDDVLDSLLAAGYAVTFRPHPQTVKFSGELIDGIGIRLGGNPAFTLEVDVSSEGSLHQSDLMIGDWSGAALDYAFGMEKPVLFIDVARKVNNASYGDIELQPYEVGIREQIGAVISPQDIGALLPGKVAELLRHMSGQRIRAIRERDVFNVGCSGDAGAQALQSIVAGMD